MIPSAMFFPQEFDAGHASDANAQRCYYKHAPCGSGELGRRVPTFDGQCFEGRRHSNDELEEPSSQSPGGPQRQVPTRHGSTQRVTLHEAGHAGQPCSPRQRKPAQQSCCMPQATPSDLHGKTSPRLPGVTAPTPSSPSRGVKHRRFSGLWSSTRTARARSFYRARALTYHAGMLGEAMENLDGASRDLSPTADEKVNVLEHPCSPRLEEVPTPSGRRSLVPAAPRAHMETPHAGAAPFGRTSRGSGLLSPDVFSRYDVDKNGRLGIAEFVFLLRDNGVEMDYCTAVRMMDYSKGLDFGTFLELLVSSLHETKTQPEIAMAVPRSIFNSYDVNRSGMLEKTEYLNLLADHGRMLHTVREPDALDAQLGDRQQSSPFTALAWDGFLELMRAFCKEDLGEH